MRAIALTRGIVSLFFSAHLSSIGLVLGLSAISLVAPPALFAEREPFRPPADGAWVRYLIEIEPEPPAERKFDVTITLSLVGTLTEEGMTYRWLESKTEACKTPDTVETSVTKVLVPEADLFESSKPFGRVRRMWGWTSRSKDPPMMMPATSEILKNFNWRIDEERMLWTPGMLEAARPLENELKIVDYQGGQLKCTLAFSGEFNDDRPARGKGREAPNARIVHKTKYTVWLHPDVPFGFAESRNEWERTQLKSTARGSTIYRLQDFGMDAKSALPESN